MRNSLLDTGHLLDCCIDRAMPRFITEWKAWSTGDVVAGSLFASLEARAHANEHCHPSFTSWICGYHFLPAVSYVIDGSVILATLY